MAKKNQHAKLGFGTDVNTPEDAIHMGAGKRIRLADVPLPDSAGDHQVGNRIYNDERYQARTGGSGASTTRWLTPLVVQWSGAGLVYNHSQATYEIAGHEGIFTVAAGQKTLVAADPDNPRFDRFVANTDLEVLVVEGDPAADPAEPSLPFPDTQIAGPVVLVGAGMTEPDTGAVQDVLVFNENTGHPSEFTVSYSGSGTANPANTNFPHTGFISIDASDVQNNSTLEFIAPTDFNTANYDSIGMQLRLKALMAGAHYLRARFYNNAGTAISNEVILPINKSLAGAYQFIGLPMNLFTFSATNGRRIRLRWTRGLGSLVIHPGFYLDSIRLQGGIPPIEIAGDITLTGQASGSGPIGSPIPVTLTETAISDQTEQSSPLTGTEHLLGRTASGSLVKIPTSLLATRDGSARFVRGGTWIWKEVGFQFETVDTEYYLPGVTNPIFVPATEIDLADYTDEGELDNGANPQFVAPQWDINGNVIPIFGPASSDPIEPAVEFPDTQIAGTSLLLNAGATSIDPGEVPTQVIFAEGAVGEATLTKTGAGTANYADTNDPIGETISANISNPENGSSTEAAFVADFVPGNFTLMVIKVQLKAGMMAGHNLGIFFRNAAGAITSNTIFLPIDKNSLEIQTIALTLSSFTFNSAVVKKIVLRWYRAPSASAVHAGFRFDNWLFQNGIQQPVLGGDVSLVGHTKGMGKVGENIFTTITEKAISEQDEQTDALPSAAEGLFRLPDGKLVKVPASLLATAGEPGAPGSPGAAGTNGWTPTLAVESDGARRVHKILDWTGGTGTKPASGLYVGASGLVENIADGVDIRGASGESGTGGGGTAPDPYKVIWTFDGDREFPLVFSDENWKAVAILFAENRSIFLTKGLTLASDGLSVTLKDDWSVDIGSEIVMWFFLKYDSETPPEEIPPIIPPAPDPAAITPVITHFLDRPNFNDVSVGVIDDDKYGDLFYTSRGVREDGDKEVVERSGVKYVRHGFDEGKWAYDTGMNEWLDITACKEAWLAYDITPKFLTPEDAPEWSKTGKLPGLVVGSFSGKPFATGGASMEGRGGSFRIAPDKNLKIGFYIYAHGKSGQYGSDLGMGKFTQMLFEQKNRFVLRMVVNTGSDANGIAQVWHNEKLVATATNVTWTQEGIPAQDIELVSYGTFMGGGSSDPQFAAPTSSEWLQSYMHIGIGNGSRYVYKPGDVLTIFGETVGGIV